METNENVKVTELYGGKIKIKFYGTGSRHSYFVNGKRAKSVTGAYAILAKDALIPWALGVMADNLVPHIGESLTQGMIDEAEAASQIEKAGAANVGTLAHEYCELFVKGKNPEMPEDPKVLRAVTSFLDWISSQKMKFVSAEKIIYSKKYGYVGQMDAVAIIGKKRYLIDYKVSSGLYPQVAYQTAAYQKADEEESGVKYDGRWAVRLSKETEEEYLEKQNKKLNKYLKNHPDKEPYEISPYVPFEAKLLTNETVERDFRIHLLCMELSDKHYEVGREFFQYKK